MFDCRLKSDFTFIWAIENFSSAFQKKGDCIISPSFTVDFWKSNSSDWCLHLYPRGHLSSSGSGIIALILQPNNPENSGEESSNYRLELLPAYNEYCSYQEGTEPYKIKNEGGNLYEFPRDYLYDDEFLTEDTLTVRLRLLGLNGSAAKPGSCFARTRIGVYKESFIWSVPNFSQLQPNVKTSFLLESLALKLELYLTDLIFVHVEEELQIEIARLDAGKDRHSIVEISLLDADGETVDVQKDEHYFSANSTEAWKFPSFITKRLLLELGGLCLPNNVLYLGCKCTVSTGEVVSITKKEGHGVIHTVQTSLTTDCSVRRDEEQKGFDVPITLKGALYKLYKDQVCSDASLRVGNKIFPAHKAILSARSPVLREMIEDSETREGNTGIVVIPDLEENTVDQLLVFIYSETVEELECEEVMKLYMASDKYEVPQLKLKCSSLLKSDMNQSNAIAILYFSDLHSYSDLKKMAQDFVQCHGKEICSTDEWDELTKKNPQLAAETMQRVFKKIKTT